MTEPHCKICDKDVPFTINGRCPSCDSNPFSACGKCDTGNYKSKPKANWQNRFVCDKCGDEVSR